MSHEGTSILRQANYKIKAHAVISVEAVSCSARLR